MAQTDIFDDVAQGAAAPSGDIFDSVAASRKLRTSTLDELAQGRVPEAETRPIGANAGLPRSLASSLKPPTQFVDTTRIPRSPLTNQLELEPPMATVEEARRAGTIGPPPKITRTIPGPHGGFTAQISPTAGEGLARAIFPGAPQGSEAERLKIAAGGLTSGELANERRGGLRLFDPAQLMTESERQQHPILTGAGEFAGGMTSPENLALIGLTAGAGEFVGPGAPVAKRLLAAGFSIPMLISAARQAPEVADAFKRGDTYNAERLLTQMGLTAATAGLAGRGMLEEPEPLFVPKGTISRPLALDEARARGDYNARVNAQAETGLENLDTAAAQAGLDRALGRSGRRFQDFTANQSARLGMGRLAQAERGIEAARQARINAPVEIPKTYLGPEEPFLLGRPPILTPMQQLSQEATDVVRQWEARQSFQQSLRDEIAGEVVRRLRDEGLLEPRTASGIPVTDRRAVRREDIPPIERRPQPPVYPLQDEVPPLGREPGQPTQRASIMRIGSEPSAPGAIPERLPPTHGDIFDEVTGNRHGQPVKATPYQRQQAQLYVNRLRNPIEREHAQSILQDRLSGELEPERTSSLSAERARTIASNLDDYLKAAKPQSVTERFSPDIVREAEDELRSAHDLAASFERPGRYHADLGPEANAREQDKAWYGIGSARKMIADQFPWYADGSLTPATLADAVSRGKGTNYERIVGKIAEGIQRERESAQPIIEQYAPRLSELAEQVRDVDPDLAQELEHLAAGRIYRMDNLRESIERSIGNAEAAAEFSRAIEDAATEARRQASTEETPQPGGETRGEGSRLEEGILPGFERAVEEQRRAAGREAARQLTEQFNRPPESIESAAGAMERTSPLFRGTEASQQREIFRPKRDIFDAVSSGMPEPQPLNPEEIQAVTSMEHPRGLGAMRRGEFGNPRGGSELRNVLASQDVERNIAEGLKGNRRDVAGEIREEHRAELGKKPKAPGTTLYSNAFLDPAAWREAFPGMTKQLEKFGQTEIGPGERMKGIFREQTGDLVRRKEQLYKALEAKAEEWDARPARDQLDFILREQHGEKQANSTDQTIADHLRDMFRERRQQVEQLGHGAFNRWRENYFPQMWERPKQVRDWITDVLAGKRKLEGPKSFTRQRVFDDIQQGIDAGFKPLTTNPITLALAKLHEMDRYIMAHTTLDAMKKSGLAKAVMVGQQAPADWVRLDDRIGTIYGSPDIPTKEAYDKAVWDRLAEVAGNLGIKHEREVRIGGKRLGYATPGNITTRFATPESVIAHEIGHNLDWKYGLKDQLVKNPMYAKELRALADLHIEGMKREDVPVSFQRYIRKGEEKMATMVEALVHAPDKFRQVAPNTYDFLRRFIVDRPELKPLLEAKPSLRYDTRKSDVSAGGMVIHGYYYAPREAARVFNNYLSPGLQRFKAYNAMRMVGNTLNQAQLGLSAFHLGFTSLDASVSDMALALERASRGQVGSAISPAMRSLTIVGSPINTMLKGNRLLREYLEPGKYAQMAHLADAVAQAGGRVHMDPYYKNQAIESFWRAWKEGSYAKAGLRAFPAAMEYAAKPVMEYAVPRMKLGVFANLAEDALARSERENWNPERTRYELNRAWDSVDNRMGEIVYDNLFWNRAVKDLGMVSVRSLGWNLGTAREIFGGALDFTRQGARVAAGQKPEVTHRMAYVMALPIVVGFTGAIIHYLSTGKKPETLTDYFFPQTGKIGPNGRPERLSLPSYLKDLYELNQHPARTVLNKVHPAITATAEFLRNQDYFGTEIHHPGDPFLEQRLEDAEFIAKQFLPFSVRNAYQRAQSAGETGLLGPLGRRSLLGTTESMIGLVPAPRSITQTPAERLAHEDAVRVMPQGPRTREQFEHGQLLHTYENRLASGDMKLGDLRQEMAAGRITGRDAETIARTSRLAPIERDFNRLPLKDALDVWDLATPEERQMLRPILIRKQVQLGNMPQEERQAMEQRMRRALYGQSQTGLQPTPILGRQPANLWGAQQ